MIEPFEVNTLYCYMVYEPSPPNVTSFDEDMFRINIDEMRAVREKATEEEERCIRLLLDHLRDLPLDEFNIIVEALARDEEYTLESDDFMCAIAAAGSEAIKKFVEKYGPATKLTQAVYVAHKARVAINKAAAITKTGKDVLNQLEQYMQGAGLTDCG